MNNDQKAEQKAGMYDDAYSEKMETQDRAERARAVAIQAGLHSDTAHKYAIAVGKFSQEIEQRVQIAERIAEKEAARAIRLAHLHRRAERRALYIANL